MLDRRRLILSGSLVVIAGVEQASAEVVLQQPSSRTAPPSTPPEQSKEKDQADQFLVLTGAEIEFLSTVVDALIPADDLSPSGSACGVVTFIDRQLAGSYGSGARWYREGPFLPSAFPAGFGNQSPLTPLQFVQLGILDVDAYLQRRSGVTISGLKAHELDELLRDMEAGRIGLDRVDAQSFFDAVLSLTMEGFFSDPLYGGNRDKASWRMIGYPGLPATYARAIGSYRDRRYATEPKSILDFL